MRILFYAPMKPLDHPHPSGDRVIAQGLFDFLVSRGHQVRVASRLRARWIFRRPWLWPLALAERLRVRRLVAKWRPDAWLSFHTYYKSPDLLGPVAAALGVPYLVFQGMYATKYRKRAETWPGFVLNRRALLAADQVFVNRGLDGKNLARLLPLEKITRVRPGITPTDFAFDPRAREELRGEWGAEGRPVVLSAAMFRDDVKTRGLEFLIRACGALSDAGLDFLLVLAGDGVMRGRLEALAKRVLPGRVRFLGRVGRERMAACYSAAEVFAFPGIRESLGMVYLEAQSCGLPVVAFDNGGIPEVVENNVTGFLTPPMETVAFATALARLILDPNRARSMGRAGAARVRAVHDSAQNYLTVERVLLETVEKAGISQRGE
ncbi:MAG: glycosyltransferase family 4 protein [Pseudomonadota bacterium]